VPISWLARLRTSLIAPLVVVALAYGVVAYGYTKVWGDAGNPSSLIKLGQRYIGDGALLPENANVRPETGYDGQFFFYFAQDPLLQGKVAERGDSASPYIDTLAYRYQRILLPALGWLTSAGDPDVLQWTLPLINLAAILGAGWLLARFLLRRGLSPWWSLLYMLSMGVVAGTVNDLADPLATSLFIAGVVLWLEDRTAPAVAALAATLLAKETFLLPIAVICGLELVRHRRAALAWTVPLAVWAAWQLYLRASIAKSPLSDDVARPGRIPFEGLARKVREVLQVDVVGAANWELMFLLMLLLVWASYLIYALRLVPELWRRRAWKRGAMPSREALLPVVASAALALIPFLSVYFWRYPLDYSRYSASCAGLLLLSWGLRRDRWALGLAIALFALSLVNPEIGLLPTRNGVTITPLPPG